MKILGPFLNRFFTTYVKLLLVLKHYTTLFIALFCIKTKDEKSLNFFNKTMVQSFLKKCTFWACFKSMFFIANLSLLLFYNFSELFLLIHFALRQ